MSFPNTIQGAYAASWDTGSIKLYPLGQRMECPNGRIFRYAEMGSTAGVASRLYQSEVPSSNWKDTLITTALTAGSTTKVSYTLGATAQEKDDIKEGYVLLTELNDLGEVHRVAGNVAAAASGTGTLFLYPGDVFKQTVTVDTGNVITTIKNPYKDIILTPASAAAATAYQVGVPQVAIAGDAFGWVQTHGVCSCDTEGTVRIGYEARASEDTTDGEGALADMVYGEADDADIGTIARVMEVAPTTDFGTYFLTIEGIG